VLHVLFHPWGLLAEAIPLPTVGDWRLTGPKKLPFSTKNQKGLPAGRTSINVASECVVLWGVGLEDHSTYLATTSHTARGWEFEACSWLTCNKDDDDGPHSFLSHADDDQWPVIVAVKDRKRRVLSLLRNRITPRLSYRSFHLTQGPVISTR
jgi:hypothetical protein